MDALLFFGRPLQYQARDPAPFLLQKDLVFECRPPPTSACKG